VPESPPRSTAFAFSDVERNSILQAVIPHLNAALLNPAAGMEGEHVKSILERILLLVVVAFMSVDLFAQTTVTPAAGDGTAGFSGDGGPAPAASLNGPTDVAIDSAGNFYIADRNNNRIRKVENSSGTITTAAGNGDPASWYLEGGPAVTSVLNHPFGTATDAAGNWYIADFGGFSTVSFTNLFIDAQSNGDSRIHKVNAAGVISLIHVPVTLTGVLGIAVDPAGNLYIAERHAQRIFKFAQQTNVLTTIAGTGTAGFSGDGGPASAAQIHDPAHLAIDGAGNIYFSDSANNRIRKVSAATGIITTVAGTGSAGLAGDGGPAISAQLKDPEGIAVDSAGVLFIADTGNNRIRKVSASTGLINTIVAVAPTAGCESSTAALESPQGVAVSDKGDVLYIADDGGNRVWRVDLNVTPAPPTLKSIAPSTGALGAKLTVTLTGTGFSGGMSSTACQNGSTTVTVSGSGITVGNVTVNSDTSLSTELTIAPNAQMGPHDVAVATDGGTSPAVPFSVVAPMAPPPVLTSISPSSSPRGTSVTVTFTGQNFDTGPGKTTVTPDGAAISTGQIAVANTTSLTVVLSIAADAALGNHNLQVQTAAGSSNAVPFAVLPNGLTFVYNMPQLLNPTDGTPVQMSLTSPSPDSVTGNLVLTFTPNATIGADDPNVTFVSSDASTRSSNLSVPANTTNVQMSLSNGVLQAGTVAGTIELAVSNVQVAGTNVASNGSTFDVQIPRLPPVITSVRILNRTSAGFDVEVTGYSTPRDITVAAFDFGAATGQKLLTVELKPDVASTFTDYYQSPASDSVGSAFVYTQPFVIKQGTVSAVASVTVTLTNSAGTSQPQTAQ
jgi:sugar lactone lactonase YvrE